MTQELVKTYTEQLVQALNDHPKGYQKFAFSIGRRYFKVGTIGSDGKVGCAEAFVDKTTGDVYKPASWSKPAEWVRYNLLDPKSREICLNNADPYGSYLYLR